MRQKSALLLLALSCCALLTACGGGRAEEPSYTFWDAQEMILAHLEENDLDYAVGSSALYEYFVDQLYNKTDDTLLSHPHYAIITVYMKEYVKQYEEYLNKPSIFGFNMNKYKNLPIASP